MKIGYNKPYISGNEINYIIDAIKKEKISGNGHYTNLCQSLLEKKFQFKKVLLTTSCTDALEMAAILLDIKPDDEIIIPSFTFVSSANAFILRGAKIVFADTENEIPNIQVEDLEKIITPKTKAIVVVHYAGISCKMDEIMALATKHNIYVVEDAAQAINATYKGKYLGSIGHLGCLSFHETKNIMAGEGGALIINDQQFIKRAEVIWEKGTNRAAMMRGEIGKYTWIDLGSSFLPSELIAAFLFAQLESIDKIQKRRIEIWEYYYKGLSNIPSIKLPTVPSYASNNGHIFYLLCKNEDERTNLIQFLRSKEIDAIFHYLSLHQSDYYIDRHDGRLLPYTIKFSETLLRLPCYFELTYTEQDYIIQSIQDFYAA